MRAWRQDTKAPFKTLDLKCWNLIINHWGGKTCCNISVNFFNHIDTTESPNNKSKLEHATRLFFNFEMHLNDQIWILNGLPIKWIFSLIDSMAYNEWQQIRRESEMHSISAITKPGQKVYLQLIEFHCGWGPALAPTVVFLQIQSVKLINYWAVDR